MDPELDRLSKLVQIYDELKNMVGVAAKHLESHQMAGESKSSLDDLLFFAKNIRQTTQTPSKLPLNTDGTPAVPLPANHYLPYPDGREISLLVHREAEREEAYLKKGKMNDRSSLHRRTVLIALQRFNEAAIKPTNES